MKKLSLTQPLLMPVTGGEIRQQQYKLGHSYSSFKMEKLFGTDGIRSVAGEFPLDKGTIGKIGASLAALLRERIGREPRLVSGRDTRESGEWIESAIASGAVANGAVWSSAGVLTTPGVAHIAWVEGFDAGVVISASHNPYRDNGIKIFMPDGQKADSSIESGIEKVINSELPTLLPTTDLRIDRSSASRFQDRYIQDFREEFSGLSLSGLKLVVDCANGAACDFAPKLFSDLGADVRPINNTPDGRNINENCGSLHLEGLQAAVRDHGADAGIAFDGDADRTLLVDENGNFVDGDGIMWVLAGRLLARDRLKARKVAATVMSNIGLEIGLRNLGIELLRTDVGDKYVLQELIDKGLSLGGEQSGHIIIPEKSLVGDGIRTALVVLEAMVETGKPLFALLEGFVSYPQILVNVPVKEKRPFGEVPAVRSAADKVTKELEGRGRLLLRYSGTENLARIMIEGPDQVSIEAQARELGSVIREQLG